MTPSARLTLRNDLDDSIRYWLDRVLSCLGIPNADRQECIARGTVALGDVVLMFLEPGYGERSFILVRALADEMPPAGHCEPLFQMALEVQGNFCGPHVPMLCLDWPSRVLMVSVQLDVTSLPADDAAQVLLGLREMALQWRAAIAEQRDAAARPVQLPAAPSVSP